MFSGTAREVLSSGLALISLPLAVRYLGAERYGVWATVTTTAVWINLLDLGIANTLTNHISRAYALDDKAIRRALLHQCAAAHRRHRRRCRDSVRVPASTHQLDSTLQRQLAT